MSKEQLKTLQRLSQLFAEGSAGTTHIQQLSALLTEINHIEKSKVKIKEVEH